MKATDYEWKVPEGWNFLKIENKYALSLCFLQVKLKWRRSIPFIKSLRIGKTNQSQNSYPWDAINWKGAKGILLGARNVPYLHWCDGYTGIYICKISSSNTPMIIAVYYMYVILQLKFYKKCQKYTR